MKILLRGYYGYKNFGDDLLMMITYRFAREIFPNAKIEIFSFSNSCNYIQSLIPNSTIVSNTTDSYDLILHGGGGVLFDFRDGSKPRLLMNNVAHIIGKKTTGKIVNRLRETRGIGQGKTDLRVGLCLGVGTYTKNSKKLIGDLAVITDFNYLYVRDTKSIENSRKLYRNIEPTLSTDLAFATNFWINNNTSQSNKYDFGIILRNGEKDAYNEEIIEFHQNSNQTKLFIVFDPINDAKLISMLAAKDLEFVVWDPESMTIHEFCKIIANCSRLITSRAHGAIVAALLGTTPIILNIEPKLKTIHDMLGLNACLIKPENYSKELEAVDINAEKLEIDENINRINSTLDELKNILKSRLNPSSSESD